MFLCGELFYVEHIVKDYELRKFQHKLHLTDKHAIITFGTFFSIENYDIVPVWR